MKIHEDQRNLQQPATETKERNSYIKQKKDSLRSLVHSVKQSLRQTIKKTRVFFLENYYSSLKNRCGGVAFKGIPGTPEPWTNIEP